jgi:hypothetical protein
MLHIRERLDLESHPNVDIVSYRYTKDKNIKYLRR